MNPVLVRTFDLSPGKGDLKRLEILEAAIPCIASEGFEGGTLAKIADKLKTRRSHVSYYYKDKHRLFEDVIRYVIATAQDISIRNIEAEGNAVDQIVAMSNAAFDWAEKHPDQAKVLMYFHFECCTKPHYRELNTRIREAGTKRIHSLLQAIPGRKKSGLTLEQHARALQALMSGLVVDAITLESRRSLKQMAAQSIRLWIQTFISAK